MPENILDRWIECTRCRGMWPQSNNEPKVCPTPGCGCTTFVYKYTALNDVTDHAMVKDKDRVEAMGLAKEIKRVRGEKAEIARGKRGRRQYFTIPKGML